jgi:hypothetical protein
MIVFGDGRDGVASQVRPVTDTNEVYPLDMC